MKTIDTKSLLIGILATSLVLILTSGKTLDTGDNIEFIASPTGAGIYNKTTKTMYLYKVAFGGTALQEKPNHTYKVAEDGSSLTQKD